MALFNKNAIITPSQNPKAKNPTLLAAIIKYPDKAPKTIVTIKITQTTAASVSGPITNSPKTATKIPKPLKYPIINNVGFNNLYPKKHSSNPTITKIIENSTLWFPKYCQILDN